MLGTWSVVKFITDKLCEVKCDNCGTVTQKFKKHLTQHHRCPSIIGDTKYCYKCQNRLSLHMFHVDTTVYGGYSKLCRECYSTRVGSNYRKDRPVKRRHNAQVTPTKSSDDIEKFFDIRQKSLKYRCSNKNIPYNLPDGYLFDLYNRQKKLCYYTKQEIIPHTGGLTTTTLSIDRLDPSLGYVDGNLVLCLFCINSLKGNKTESEFKELLANIVPHLTEYIND